MIWIILVSIAVVTGISTYARRRRDWRREERATGRDSWTVHEKPSLFWWCFGMPGLAAVAFALALMIGAGVTTGPQVYTTYELRALQTTKDLEGRFFLGTGTIKEERMVAYLRYVDGYTELRSAPADRSRIFEDGGDKPYVQKWGTVIDNPVLLPFKSAWRFGELWDFHVPAGSVIENYTVEAE